MTHANANVAALGLVALDMLRVIAAVWLTCERGPWGEQAQATFAA